MDKLISEEYKLYEINGEKYFPESAVRMLIDEAKKQLNKHPVSRCPEGFHEPMTGIYVSGDTPTKTDNG